MQVDECIASIMAYQTQEERKFLNAVYKLSVVHHPKYDHEMEFLSRLVSEHACELVYEQYKFATTAAKYKFHEASVVFELVLFVLATQLLNSCWLLSSLRVESEFPQLNGESFRVSRVLKETSTCWNSNRKFREANFLATSISEHLSGLGMVEYRAAMKALRSVATLFKHGDVVNPQASGGEAMSSVASGSSIESTQVCVEPQAQRPRSDELGSAGDGVDTGPNELGTGRKELGTVPNELGTRNEELGTGPVEEGKEDDEFGVDIEPSAESGGQGSTLSHANLSDDFRIVSPPKSRGRSKKKPQAVKAKRKHAVTLIQNDWDMHERRMSLLVVNDLLGGVPTYKSSHEKLLQFKQFMFTSRPKSPIAHELTKLPPTKPPIRLEEVVRVFPMELINKYTAKVTAYQAKHRGTLEMQVALEIVGLGVSANSTVALMRKWHTAVKTTKKIKRALTWIAQLDFTRYGNSSFHVEEDPAIPTLLESMPILSNEYADIVDLAAKETLSAQVMQLILHNLFGADPSIRVIDPSNLGVSYGAITTEIGHFKRAFAGATKTMKILCPINCNNSHWCAVLMDLGKCRAYVYDSMASSYISSVLAVTQQLVIMLPEDVRPNTRLLTHDPGLGVQTDSYNCGVYVLLAFEIFCGSEPLGHIDKKTLQCMRYRYLRKYMIEEGNTSS
ncbi:unnamed protein product [Phytophthora fragariaefolia]|uniref:Unnamed protein product n=1 Tax=Phytophthora fragariaefolia TaxID=1490495 RepID=A0A9W6YQ30_9STRA|nr:unnamed protein product [Phytophthora fragariaefolia]